MRRSPKPPRAMTSACRSSCCPKNKRSPTPIFLPGRTRHSHSLGWCDNWRVRRTSIWPWRKSREAGFARLNGCAFNPLLLPKRRAGNTRVLLNTTRSSGRRRSGKSRNWESRSCPELRFRCRRREAARSESGSWAMSSSGSAKLKSETSTLDYRICAPTKAVSGADLLQIAANGLTAKGAKESAKDAKKSQSELFPSKCNCV